MKNYDDLYENLYDNLVVMYYRSTKWCRRYLGEVHGGQTSVEAGIDPDDQSGQFECDVDDQSGQFDGECDDDADWFSSHLPKMSMW